MEGGSLGLAARGGLAAALCALAGCGGTSIADYSERAGTICRQATEPLKVRVQGQDFGDLARLATEARRRYADALARLADLEPPETRRPEHEALVTAGRRLRERYDRLGAAVDRVDEEGALAALRAPSATGSRSPARPVRSTCGSAQRASRPSRTQCSCRSTGRSSARCGATWRSPAPSSARAIARLPHTPAAG